MKSNLEISIVIPAYNAEKYISRCIESIMSAKLKEDSFEIIAIDDSSTDATQAILNELSEDIPQLKVYRRQKSGPGGARNLGLNYAKGRYIMFVDIDDHLNSKNLSHFVNTLLPMYEQDIIGFDYLKVDEEGNRSVVTKKIFPYCREMSGAEYMNIQAPQSVLWGYVYRRKFLLENSLKFIEKNIHDNEYFLIKAFCLAEKVTFIPTQLYYYHYAIPTSLTNKPDETHQELFIKQLLDVITELQKFGFMLGDPLSEEGLERKLDLLTARLIRRLIALDYNNDFIEETLQKLESMELYPLRKAKYSLRYRMLRKATKNPCKLIACKEYKKSKIKNLFTNYFLSL
ncbi:MAG: glycosyltransferase [Bacteroidales bacterium]|nr:glycosyltransferase [Bacteroidales bacterium]